MRVKPKKYLGQHFLENKLIAQKIVDALVFDSTSSVLEIGPGKGVLTDILIEKWGDRMKCIEIDSTAVQFLHSIYLNYKNAIINGDFLKISLTDIFQSTSTENPKKNNLYKASQTSQTSQTSIEKLKVIGNFPYNISSQILFKVLEYKNKITEVVCMLQKEVAHRLVAPPGTRACGILSVLIHLWYDVEYLFEVEAKEFHPPPKVQSAVIRLTRNERKTLPIEYPFFKNMIKRAFNNRRKTLRNALKLLNLPKEISQKDIFNQRAEQLSLDELLSLAVTISSYHQSTLKNEHT